MVALAGKNALVKAAQASAALTNAATTDSGTHLVYTITDPTKQVLDPQATITVGSNSGASTTLSAALATGVAITALPVVALTEAIAIGASITVTSGVNSQVFTTSAAAAIGAVSIPVNSTIPNFAYPIGSTVVNTTTVSVLSPTLYTLNRLFGIVTFAVARAANEIITVSGQYLPLMTLVEAHQFQYQFKSAVLDASRFQDTWMERQYSLKDTHYQITVFREQGDTFVDDLFGTTNVFMVEIWSNSYAAGPDIRGWALMTQLQEQGQIAAIQSQVITGEGTADADGRVVSNGTF